jgi:hypothetical protein
MSPEIVGFVVDKVALGQALQIAYFGPKYHEIQAHPIA